MAYFSGTSYDLACEQHIEYDYFGSVPHSFLNTPSATGHGPLGNLWDVKKWHTLALPESSLLLCCCCDDQSTSMATHAWDRWNSSTKLFVWQKKRKKTEIGQTVSAKKYIIGLATLNSIATVDVRTFFSCFFLDFPPTSSCGIRELLSVACGL